MASKSVTVQQFKQLQYQAQIIKSYLSKIETSLKCYNSSGSEQFLALTRLKLESIQQKILADRQREQQLKLENIYLSAQINTLKKDRDALYKEIKAAETKSKSSDKVCLYTFL